MITDPNVYFEKGCDRCERFDTPDCKVNIWRDGLAELRRIGLSTKLEEGAKWGQPVYMLDDKNVCLIGAFNDLFFISFFDAANLRDDASLLKKRGKNTQAAHMFEFTTADEVIALEATIRAYIAEAIDIKKAGGPPKKTPPTLVIPEELKVALGEDAELAKAFESLTQGRKRGYCIHISGAKQSSTRRSRIEKLRPKILEGKGFNER